MKNQKKLLAILLCFAMILSPVTTSQQADAKQKIRLSKKKITIVKGKKKKLKVKGTKKKVTWRSKKKKIATVNKKGVVRAKKVGKTKIIAKVAGKKLVCKVKVKKKKATTDTTTIEATQTPKATAIPSSGGGDSEGSSSTGATATATPVGTGTPVLSFSAESGCYDEAFDLELEATEGATIYYTTDGSDPLYEEEGKSADDDAIPAKEDTIEYTGAIRIKNRDSDANRLCSATNIPYMYDPTDYYNGAFYPEVSAVPKATIIRAVAVGATGKKSDVITKVYFVDKDLQSTYAGASVISIVTDPDNLLSKTTGIYRYGNWENSGDEWERPAEVTYIDEDGSIPFETTMGLRIHGGYTRRWGQKSLRLYFREELGMKNLKGYQLIPDAVNADGEATTKYKRFILRNGGNEYAYSKMQDVFIQSMVSDRDFATQSARPCVVFLNGEYWGIYNLTERYSDNYLEEEYGVDKDDVIVIKNGELDEGTESDYTYYEELKNMANLDMSQSENYDAFKELVDIQSFMDYYATEIYIGNVDWPNNNTQLWRTRTVEDDEYGDTKWRYMLYDTEYSMDLWGHDSGGETDRIAEAISKDSLFAALCENEEFCQEFADTLMDICRNNFDVDKASAKLDEMATIYRPLIKQYKARFGNGDVDSRVNGMKSFIKGREDQLIGFIQSTLGVTVSD